MKSLWLFLTLISCTPIGSLAQSAGLDSLVKKLGNQFLERQQSLGLSVGIYERGDEHLFHFGSVEKGKKISPSDTTRYEIGSIAKTFSSYLLARAIISNQLHPDDDIRKYMEGSFPNLAYGNEPIKIVHLANGTSGLPDWLPPTPEIIRNAPPDSVAFLRNRIYAGFTREDFFGALKQVKLDTIPGHLRQHSNAAGDLLAYILEAVYGRPYDQLVDEYIFRPFGMRSTGLTSKILNTNLLAKGYNGNGLEMPYSNGGFSSSLPDLLRYARLHLEGNEITQVALTKTASLDLRTNRVVLRDTNVYSVALNWFSYQLDENLTQTWYDGGTHGFLSYIVFYTGIDAAIVLLTNVADEKAYSMLPGMAFEICKLLRKEE